MGFYTKAQRLVIRDLIRRKKIHDEALRIVVRRFDGDNLHSQACDAGGLQAGGHCSFSGETPCPCGIASDENEMTLVEAYAHEGIPLPPDME